VPGSELVRGSPNERKIALTFDAGSSRDPAPAILETLRSEGVRATFFLTGRWAEKNPDLVRAIARDGHLIGNHSYSHPDFRRLSATEIAEEIEKTEKIIEREAGVSTKPYFRPPYGGLDRRVLDTIGEAGYITVYWSVDSWDGFKKGITADEIRRRVLSRAKPGAIVLMHCGNRSTAEALPEIIRSLRAQGYELVPVSEL